MLGQTQSSPDQRARELERIILKGPEVVGIVEYSNAREKYLDEVPPDRRQIQIAPTPDEVWLLNQQCSAADSRDQSAVRQADRNRAAWARKFPQMFPPPPRLHIEERKPTFSFDEQASRRALKDHLQAMRDAQRRVDRLLAVDRAASAAAERERHAEAALAEIEQRERERWAAWCTLPNVPYPEPDAAAKAAAFAELTAARDICRQADAARQRVQPQYQAAVAELRELAARRDVKVADVLASALPHLVRHKMTLEGELRSVRAAIDEIGEAMDALGGDKDRAMEAAAYDRGQHRSRLARLEEAARDRIRRWAAKLLDHPEAEAPK